MALDMAPVAMADGAFDMASLDMAVGALDMPSDEPGIAVDDEQPAISRASANGAVARRVRGVMPEAWARPHCVTEGEILTDR